MSKKRFTSEDLIGKLSEAMLHGPSAPFTSTTTVTSTDMSENFSDENM